MRTLTLSVSLSLALSAVAAGADPAPQYGWSTSGDDTVRCMAIGCAPGDYERYPEYAPQPIEDPAWGQPAAPQPYIPVIEDGYGQPREQADYGHDVGDLLRHLQPHPIPELGETREYGGAPELGGTHEYGGIHELGETPELAAPQPALTEEDAREDFYRALREHAGGKGSIEEVEEAYQQLQQIR